MRFSSVTLTCPWLVLLLFGFAESTKADTDVAAPKLGIYFGVAANRMDYDMPNLDAANGYGIFTGIQFNRHFGIEASYTDFGQATHSDLSLLGNSRWQLGGESSALLARFSLPIAPKADLFMEAGYHHWRLTLTETGFGRVAHMRGNDAQIGGGGKFYLSRTVAGGLRFQTLNVSNGRIGVWSAFAQLVF